MERNRLEAEARVIAKKFGAEKLGLTWVKALLAEFKKPYMQEVSFDLLPEGGGDVCCSADIPEAAVCNSTSIVDYV